jgi:hypothetical protein
MPVKKASYSTVLFVTGKINQGRFQDDTFVVFNDYPGSASFGIG